MITIFKITILSVLFLSASCTSLFFHPERELLLTPKTVGLEYRDLYFKMSDGELIHGWFLPAKVKSKKTIFFLHGNAENISTHLASVYWLPAEGFNVIIIDYRGYGFSTGEPEIAAIHRDIFEVLPQLAEQTEVENQQLIIFGQSLGATIALTVATNPLVSEKAAALVVESPFLSYQRIAREKLLSVWLFAPGFWLTYLAIDDSFSPVRRLEEFPDNWPVLVLYCENDEVVPSTHSKELVELLAEKSVQGWGDSECGHIGFLQSETNRERLVEWLNFL